MLIAIAFSGIAVLVLLSVSADVRFRDRARLPMQWRLSGEVSWSAPRRLALAFIPLLAALVLLVAVVLLRRAGPETAQGGAWAVAFIAAAFVAVHLLHLWMIGRRSD